MNAARAVGITGTGAALPERVLTNAELEKMVDTSDEWIVSRSGIRERHIADPETATSDLCVEAAEKALARAGVPAADVDLIIVGTVTPDFVFPATASLVQDRIGAKHAAAFDLLAGCSGFLYGLTVGSQMIASGLYRTVLVIGADVLSRITDWTDRRTCVLFGDGAGAVVLQPVEPGQGLLACHLGSDGSGGDLLIQPAGGSRRPAAAETVQERLHYIQMNGSEVFKFAVRILGEAADRVLAQCGLERQDIDLLIPHQANIRIVEAASKRLGLGPDKIFVNLEKYGNMSAASIPVALDEAWSKGLLKPGMVVLLVGFGAGLTWGAAVLKWSQPAAH